MKLVLAVVAAVIVFVQVDAAEACSCHTPGPPCATLFTSTVFVGKVTSVATGKGGVAQTTFEVVETLHADFALPKSLVIQHGTIGSMCGITFEQGTTYVVYAGGASATALGVGACSSTHVFRKGDPDVALARAKSTRTTALVEGRASLSIKSDQKPLAGVEVRAAGTKITAKSNGSGAFKLEVPPGKYTLEVLNKDLRLWQGREVSINVPVAAACARPSVLVSYDGRVEGTVTDPAGKPVPNLEVHVIAKRPEDQYWRLSARTDAQGHYIVHEVPAGTYTAGVSLPDYGAPDPASPHPTTYYPGTPDRAKATWLATKQAGLADKIDFQVPAALKVVTYKGTVKKANGALAAGGSISIVPQGRNRSTGGLVDDKGTYVLQELAGETVVIKACVDGKCQEVTRKVTADETIDFTLK